MFQKFPIWVRTQKGRLLIQKVTFSLLTHKSSASNNLIIRTFYHDGGSRWWNRDDL